MRVTILGRHWNFEYVPRMKRRGWFGVCEHPDTPHRTIKIESGHPPQLELTVTIHECLHATCFPLSEEFVTESATDLAKILWRLGWRKTEQSKPE